jgi:foldase protein PrsA
MVIKKTENSNEKKAKIIHVGKKNSSDAIWKWTTIILLIALIVVSIYYYFPFEKFSFGSNNNEDKAIAKVNGEEIYQSELDKNWNAIPIQSKVSYTKEMLLENLIEQKLLLQKADELNISLENGEVDSYIQMQLMMAGMNETTFDEILKQQGSSLDDLKEIYAEQLLIAKLFEEEITTDLNVTDDEVKTYYDENKEKFFQEEMVTTKHILVMISEEFTDEQAKERADMILEKVNSGKDFCELVSNYSMDLGSVENCGEYTFGKGYMVEEFENASFEMDIDEVRMVKSSYGYHIIKKITHTEAKTLTLEDTIEEYQKTVSEIVKELMVQEKAKAVYDDYLSNLKENSKIELIKTTIPPTGDVVIEDKKEKEYSNLEDFANCLTEKGAKMYGAYWCSHCNAQKDMFGDAKSKLPYVECDENGEGANIEECTTNNIQGFPTWVINGEQYMGKQSFEKLAELTGCTL